MVDSLGEADAPPVGVALLFGRPDPAPVPSA